MRKKAIALPLILFLLALLAVLGLLMNKSAMHEYRFTYRSGDHVKAMYIAKGVINACIAQIKENANKEGELRKSFVDESGGKLSFTLSGDYKTAVDSLVDALNEKEASAKMGDSSFTYKYELTLSDAFDCNGVDQAKRLMVTATVTYKGPGGLGRRYSFDKKITQCFDVKVADVRPPGNKYSFMVAKAQKEDFNKGEHFWVSNKDPDEGTEAEGISINGGKVLIDLYGKYYKHSKWNSDKSDEKYDLSKSDTNSQKSLIPGWADGNDAGPIQPSGSFVADNEPWEEVFSSPGTKPLSALSGAASGKSSPSFNNTGVHQAGDKHNLLVTGGGTNLESSPQPCGGGVVFKDFKHPLSGNNFFFNAGRDTGKTHLFYKNCDTPSPIFGNVWKSWDVYGYKARGTSDTGLCAGVPDTSCYVDSEGVQHCCQAHLIHSPGEKWDATDMAYFKNKGRISGHYQINKSGWSKWDSGAIPINKDLNFKSTDDFGGDFIADFLKGASRIVNKLSDDPTLVQGNKIFAEGMIKVENGDNCKFEINNPCMLISDNGFSICSAKIPSSKNAFFAPYPRLSLVTANKVKFNNGNDQYVGICAKDSIIGNKIKLHGNLVIDNVHKDAFDGELLYDGILKKLSEEDYGSPGHSDAAYVVTISPIPQEFFDWTNLK